MGKITDRLIGLAFTDGSFKNFLEGVKSYIKQAKHSALNENDRNLFMLHVLALLETAAQLENKKETLETFSNHFAVSSLDVEDVLNRIQKSIETTKEFPLNETEFVNRVAGAALAISITPKKVEILNKYYPESVKKELATI